METVQENSGILSQLALPGQNAVKAFGGQLKVDGP